MGMKTRIFLCLLPLLLPQVLRAVPADTLFRVGVVLPFKATGSRGGLSEAALDYYEGIRLALEDLEQMGMKVRLYVFDSQRDSAALDEMLAHPDTRQLDLMLGPVIPNELDKVARYCGQYGIPLVSPWRFYAAPVGSNCLVFNPFSNDSTRMKALTEKALWYYPGVKVVALSDNSSEAVKNIENMKQVFKAYTKRSFKVVPYNATNPGTQLPVSDSVVIIVPMSRTTVLASLNKYLESNPKAVLIGHPSWYEKMENTLSNHVLNQVILPEMNFVDYSEAEVYNFRLRYRTQYYSEPSRFTYMGYDQLYFFGQALMAFGRDFSGAVSNGNFRMLQHEYNFKKRNGYLENYGINFVSVRDLQPIKLKP
jgi:hypothetical protein